MAELPVASLSLLLLCAAPAWAASPPATLLQSAPPLYEVEEVGRSSWGLTIPNDVNNWGHVVGEWDAGEVFAGGRHAFARIDGEWIDLTPDDGIVIASARAINDAGQIAGEYRTDGSFLSGGFRWRGGVREVLPTFAPGHQSGFGISAGGLVVGRAMHENYHTNATAWSADLSQDRDLGELGQGTGAAYDINGWDTIVGSTGVGPGQSHAFVWTGGEMHDIGALPGDPVGRAMAVNEYDEVVGYSGTVLDDHAIYWSLETGMVDLGDLGYGYGASAWDINDAGVIVGYAYGPAGRVGAVWHDRVPYDLNDLLVDGKGWTLGDAQGINERGQIVGFGKHDGVRVAYLLTPVGTPQATVIGPTPGQAGATNTIEIVAASPGAVVRVFYGYMAGRTRFPDCPRAVVDIAAPQSVDVVADGEGRGTAQIFVAAEASGERLLVQAVDLANCDVTNRIVRRMD